MASVKILSAMAYDLQTYEREGVADPVIRVLGELPAYSQPFGINRVYKGAQGVYEEKMLLVDPDDYVVWESDSRFLELRGMMFEDLFRVEVREDIRIETADEHVLVFLMDGSEAGRIPAFIDAPESLTTSGVLPDAAETALKKGSILWLDIPQVEGGTATRPAWYVQQGRKLFVIKGGTEQELPNLENCDVVDVIVKSKDINATIGVMKAAVRIVDPATDEFDQIATLGMGTRLNLRDGEAAKERWRSTCTMVELTPEA